MAFNNGIYAPNVGGASYYLGTQASPINVTYGLKYTPCTWFMFYDPSSSLYVCRNGANSSVAGQAVYTNSDFATLLNTLLAQTTYPIGTVHVAAGNYTLSKTILLPNQTPCVIEGEGWGGTLSGVNYGTNFNFNASQGRAFGDNNNTSQTSVYWTSLKNFKLTNTDSGTSDGQSYGIDIGYGANAYELLVDHVEAQACAISLNGSPPASGGYACYNSVVQNCYVHDIINTGIDRGLSCLGKHNTLCNNTVQNVTVMGIAFLGVSNNLCSHNHVINWGQSAAGSAAIDCAQNSNSVVIGNEILGNSTAGGGATGILIEGATGNIDILGNTLNSVPGNSIQVWQNGAGNNPPASINVNSNNISSGGGIGIMFNDCLSAVCSGNTLNVCNNGGISVSLTTQSQIKHIDCNHNNLYGCSTGSGNPFSLGVGPNVDYVDWDHNYIDCQSLSGSLGMGYHDSMPYSSITNNTVINAVFSDYYDFSKSGRYAPATCKLFSHNYPINPVAISSVTAGTSPYSFAALPFDAVYVITTVGGMTALKLNTQALFNGSFSVGQNVFVGANNTLQATWATTAPVFEIVPQN